MRALVRGTFSICVARGGGEDGRMPGGCGKMCRTVERPLSVGIDRGEGPNQPRISVETELLYLCWLLEERVDLLLRKGLAVGIKLCKQRGLSLN